MDFRVVFYLTVPVVLNEAGAVTFHSNSFADRAGAEALLELVLETPGVTGGGLEQFVPGIGWVVEDEVQRACDAVVEAQWEAAV